MLAIILLAIVVLLALAVGAYFMFFSGTKAPSPVISSSVQEGGEPVSNDVETANVDEEYVSLSLGE